MFVTTILMMLCNVMYCFASNTLQEGYSVTFTANHIGHYLLTDLLYPVIKVRNKLTLATLSLLTLLQQQHVRVLLLFVA
jgi:hypothetical protein